MKRGAVQRRIGRLEEKVRQLRASRPNPLFEVASPKELATIMEMLGNLKITKEPLSSQITPERTPALWDLFETLRERLNARLG